MASITETVGPLMRDDTVENDDFQQELSKRVRDDIEGELAIIRSLGQLEMQNQLRQEDERSAELQKGAQEPTPEPIPPQPGEELGLFNSAPFHLSLGIMGGASRSANSMLELVSGIVAPGADKDMHGVVPDPSKIADVDQTAVGGLAVGATQFLTGFVPVFMGLRALKWGGPFIQSGVASAAAAGITVDPHEPRIANMLKDFGIENEVVDWFATNPENNQWIERLKNVLEDVGMTMMAEGLLRSFGWMRNKAVREGWFKFDDSLHRVTGQWGERVAANVTNAREQLSLALEASRLLRASGKTQVTLAKESVEQAEAALRGAPAMTPERVAGSKKLSEAFEVVAKDEAGAPTRLIHRESGEEVSAAKARRMVASMHPQLDDAGRNLLEAAEFRAGAEGDPGNIMEAISALGQGQESQLDQLHKLNPQMAKQLEEVGRIGGDLDAHIGRLESHLNEAEAAYKDFLTRAEVPLRVKAKYAEVVSEYRPRNLQDANAEHLAAADAARGLRLARGERLFRGFNPGDPRTIRTGDDFWDSLLFVTDTPEGARLYGGTIEEFVPKDGAKILREGSAEFKKVAGKWRKGENLLEFSSRAARLAKEAGYDAVAFERQTDVGTAILNPDAFERLGAAEARQLAAESNVAGETVEQIEARLKEEAQRAAKKAERERVRSVIDDRIEVDADQTRRFLAAVEEGAPVEELANPVIFDATNYSRIISSDDVKRVLFNLAEMFGRSPKTLRVMTERSLAATRLLGQRALASPEAVRAKSQATKALKTLASAGNQADPTEIAEWQGKLRQAEAEMWDHSTEKVAEIMDRIMPGVKNLDAAITAIRFFEQSLANSIVKLSETAKHGSKADLIEGMRLMRILAHVNDLRAGVSSEIGRALSAHRILAKPMRGIDENAILKSMDDLIEAAGGDKEILKAMEGFNGLRTATQRRIWTKKILSKKGRLGRMSIEYWLNAILSGPRTWAVNFVSNTAVAFYRPAELILEGALAGDTRKIRAAAGMYFGLMRAARTMLGVHNAFEHVRAGNFRALGQDIRESAVGRAWREGELQTVPEGHRQFDIPYLANNPMGTRENMLSLGSFQELASGYRTAERVLERSWVQGFVKGLDYTVNFPRRVLTTSDELAKGMSYHANVERLAFEEAYERGLTGEAADRFIYASRQNVTRWGELDEADAILLADEMGMRSPQDAVDYLKGLDKQGSAYAQNVTFTQELLERGFSRDVQRWINKHPVLRFVVPFIRTPVNLMQFSWQRMPILGAVGRDHWEKITSGNPALKREVMAKQMMGLAIVVPLIDRIHAGAITGYGPVDPDERASLPPGWQPYSFLWKNDDGSVDAIQYSRLDPFGMFVGLVTDVYQHTFNESDAERMNLMAALWAGLQYSLKSKSYFTGASELMNALLDTQNSGKDRVLRLFTKYGQSVIPNFISQVSDTFAPEEGKPVQRSEWRPNADGALAELQRYVGGAVSAKIAWMQARGIVKLNIFGEPYFHSGGLGPDAVSPFFTTQVDTSPEGRLLKYLSDKGQGVRTDINQRMRYIGSGETMIELSWEEEKQRRELFKTAGGNTSLTLREQIRILAETGVVRFLGAGIGDFQGGTAEAIEAMITQRLKMADIALLAQNHDLAKRVAERGVARDLSRTSAGVQAIRALGLDTTR